MQQRYRLPFCFWKPSWSLPLTHKFRFIIVRFFEATFLSLHRKRTLRLILDFSAVKIKAIVLHEQFKCNIQSVTKIPFSQVDSKNFADQIFHFHAINAILWGRAKKIMKNHEILRMEKFPSFMWWARTAGVLWFRINLLPQPPGVYLPAQVAYTAWWRSWRRKFYR